MFVIETKRWNLVLSAQIAVPGRKRLPLSLIAPLVGASAKKAAQIVLTPPHRTKLPKSKRVFKLFLFSTGKINSLGSRSASECRLTALLLIDKLWTTFPGIHLKETRVSNIQLSGELTATNRYNEAKFLRDFKSKPLVVRPPTEKFRGTFVYPLPQAKQAVIVLFRTSAFVTVGLKTSREAAHAITNLARMLRPYIEEGGASTPAPPSSSGNGVVARALHGKR